MSNLLKYCFTCVLLVLSYSMSLSQVVFKEDFEKGPATILKAHPYYVMKDSCNGFITKTTDLVCGSAVKQFHFPPVFTQDVTTGSGYFLMNGTFKTTDLTVVEGNVWESPSPIVITPFTCYNLSFYVGNIYDINPVKIQPILNGVPLSGALTFSDVGNWHKISFPWQSGGETTVTIELKNSTTTAGGNDFVLDDIVLENAGNVQVNGVHDLSFLCAGSLSVPFDASKKYLWSTSATGNEIMVATSGKYWVQSSSGCTIEVDTFHVKIDNTGSAILDAGKDTSLPCGATAHVQLQATQGFLSYDWSPSGTLNKSNIFNPIASPTTTTTYTVKSFIEDKCQNLVFNGDFSKGNSDFYSEYYLQLRNTTEETYYASANSKLWNNAMDACFDHTTGSGNQLHVNGGQVDGKKVWCQDIQVAPNTDYAFTTYIQSLFPGSPAVLRFSINDQLLAAPFAAPQATCSWQKFYSLWNSKNASSAKICIVNQNLSTFGNAFALDDISFYPYKTFIDSVKVEVPSSKDVPLVTSSLECETNTLSITSSSIYDPIQWTFGEPLSGANNSATTKKAQHSYQKSGTYIVQLNAGLGCGGTFDTTFSVVLPEKLTDPFPALIRECDTSFVILNAKNSTGAQYVWEKGVSRTDSLYKVTSSGEYEVAISRNGCEDTFKAFVVFDPQLSLKNTDTTICRGDSLAVDLSPFSTVTWADGKTDKKRFLKVPLTTFKANVKSFACSLPKTISYTINELIILPPAITGDTFFCQGESTLLMDVSNGIPVTWSNGTIGNVTKVTRGGLVTATRFEKGCRSKDAVLVNVLLPPTLTLPKEFRFCALDQPEGVSLSALSNATVFTWSFDGLQVGDSTSYMAIEEGKYKLTATLQGCSSSAETQVKSSCASKLFIPTAFTPNEDGNNDTLQFFHSNITFFHIRIFSRWGEVVYDSKTVEKGWDGSYRNQALPSGVYNYRVLYAGEQTAQKEAFGEVTIVR